MSKDSIRRLDSFIDEIFKNSSILEFNEKIEDYKIDVLDDPLALAEMSQTGIPWNTMEKISNHLGFTDQEWSGIFNISLKSLQRYRSAKTPLNTSQSDRLLEMVNMIILGLEAFPEPDKLKTWLRRPSFALGGHTPISLLNVSHGQKVVYYELGRIIHGIPA